jgi:hypothetical protein
MAASFRGEALLDGGLFCSRCLCSPGYQDVAELLLQKQAPVNVVMTGGRTALDWALQESFFSPLAVLLRQHGAICGPGLWRAKVFQVNWCCFCFFVFVCLFVVF